MTPHEAYRIWFNDFLTKKYFAEYYGITLEKAKQLIAEGKAIEEKILELKQNEKLRNA